MNIFKPIIYLDSAFLHCYQCVSDKVQTWVGQTNFDLARITCALWLLLMIVRDGLDELVYKLIAGFALIFLTFVVEHRTTRSRSDVGTRNELEVSPFFTAMRNLNNIFLMLDVVGILLAIPGASDPVVRRIVYVSFYYFLSCTPKPPSKSKLQQGIEALGRAMTRVTTPAVAVPVSA